jgi:integrase
MRVNGVYYFRERVPRDLVPVVGRCWVKESLRTKNATLARALQAQVAAKYAAEWQRLRKNPTGGAGDLRDVTAIAGEVYRQILEREGAKPRHGWTNHQWLWQRARLLVATDRETWPNGVVLTRAEKLAVIEKLVGEDLDAVLKRAGMIPGLREREILLQYSGDAAVDAFLKLMKECNGDFSPDPNAARFPPFVPPAEAVRRSPLAEDVWRGGEPRWSAATQRKYRHALDDFLAQLPSYGLHKTRGDWDLAKITRDHVRAWRDSLLVRLKDEASPRTIQREYLGSLKAIFAYAVRGERLRENPAKGIYVEQAWGEKAADMRGFFDEEAIAILRASLAPPPPRLSAHSAAARRWVPWLCAYTGARVNEITQLRGQDVVEREGCWCICITPDAGSQKQGSKRLVPLKDHLVEQGFLAFARQFRPRQPLFHTYEMPELADTPENKDLRNEHRRRAAAAAATVGGRLATWVRSLKGLTDTDVDPNHGWRHRFKTKGRARDMDPVILDAIQGHAPPNVSAKYGDFPPSVTAPQIAKLERIEIGDAPAAEANA